MERDTATGRRDQVLSRRSFSRLSSFIIQATTGIKVPESKKIMLEARLHKRLRLLNLSSLDEYCDYLFTEKGMEDESVHMIDADRAPSPAL